MAGRIRSLTRAGVLAMALLSVVGATAGPAGAASRYDPRLRFRTISTPRFDIHYHQGEDAAAQRLARIAEDVATAMARTLGPPAGRVQVILVNQDDLPNGWATPVPYNTIEITVAAPTAGSVIGNVDDWLRMVFTHEYTHIVHLSRAGGWIGGLRRVFGRLPLLHPNLFQPIWQIEGIATWQESELTGRGRVFAGDFREWLDRAAATRQFESLDRASHGIVDWPGGNTPYLYGAYFHEYLARRFGPDSIARLADETARTIPYFGSFAYRTVFGASLGELWQEYQEDARARTPRAASATASAASRLTHHGFSVGEPRFAGNDWLLYSVANPHGFPALLSFERSSGQSRRVADRYLGGGLGVAGTIAVFDQIEIVRDTGRQSDLYAVDLHSNGGGTVRRLTRGARAADPDLAPDGSAVVYTVQHADRRELAVARLHGGALTQPATLVSEPGVDFASPRWSPDGRSIAAERRQLGGPSEIAIVDAETGRVRTLVAAGRDADPAWLPDGSGVLFASSQDGSPFRILGVNADGMSLRRLEHVDLNAQSPAVSPDGELLVFVGYTSDGYDLFSIPLRDAKWTPLPVPAPPARADAAPELAHLPAKSYSPGATLLPRFWTPVVDTDEGELVAGAATAGADVLGRHGYAVDAGWSARARPDWRAAYVYDRRRPTLYAAVSDDTDPWRGGERRVIEASAGVVLPSRRIRWNRTVLGELYTSEESFGCPAGIAACRQLPAEPLRRVSARIGLAVDASRRFGYSVSREEGWRVATSLESARAVGGGEGSSLSATVDARGYVRAWPRHAAVALRGAAAGSWGEIPVRRLFSASGSDSQPGGIRFGSDAIGLIRGMDGDEVFGHRAVVLNADYRFPLAWIERGVGTIPLFLRSIHGAVFADAGTAWSSPARFTTSEVRHSLGAELSSDIVLGYVAPLTAAAGAAWRGGAGERGWSFFVRLGSSF